VATGSPFPAVDLDGRTVRIGQCNNAFIFPGVGLGLWVGRVPRVTDGMFLDAAKALAAQVTNADLVRGAVYPEVQRIRSCSHAVACAVIRRAVAEGLAPSASLRALEATVADAMWAPEYPAARSEKRHHDELPASV
jgi:malic enzyme